MYDLILVPGNGYNSSWGLPPQVINRLKLVAKLYDKGLAPKIAVLGKWSIVWDVHARVKPPITEARLMKNHLISLGVPATAIYMDERSKDTIGNAFFAKKLIIERHHFKKLLVVCEDFHLKRCKFLFKKIIPGCEIGFMTTKTHYEEDEEFTRVEEAVYRTQEDFLLPMQPGDDAYLEQRLYDDDYYQGHRALGRAGQIAMGKFE